MLAASIPIESYRVGIFRNQSVPFTRLMIAGSPTTDGIRDRATLFFFPTYESLNGWAFNVGGSDGEGVHVVAQIPFDDFDRMYDLLRSEAPLHLSYTFEASDSTRKLLISLAIESGDEPPGEGPHDADSVEALVASLMVSTAGAASG